MAGCCESLAACCVDLPEWLLDVHHTWMGALSKWQRVLFCALILTAVVVNALFVQYVIARTQHASASPSTVISRVPADSFPDFDVFVNAVDTTASGGGFGFCHINPPDPALGAAGTRCQLLDRNNQPVAGGGSGTELLPQQTPYVSGQYQCLNWTRSSLLVRVPSALWRNGTWLPLTVAAVPTVPSPNASASVHTAGASANANPCSLYVSVIGHTDLIADNSVRPSTVAEDRARQRDTSLVTVGGGFTAWLELSAWSEQRLDDSDPNVHVSARPMGQMNSAAPGVAAIYLNSDAGTSPWMTTNTQELAYTWKDALASAFAVLNLTTAVFALLFPMTAHAHHQRMWLLDRPKAPRRHRQLLAQQHAITPVVSASASASTGSLNSDTGTGAGNGGSAASGFGLSSELRPGPGLGLDSADSTRSPLISP